MKKLEKLKLHHLKEIGANEQKSIKGGDGVWILGPDGQYYWYVGEVEIAAYQNVDCPRCEQNAEYGIISGNENQRFWINTIMEFFSNTLPHILGCGGHINDDYTIYRYRLEGSDWSPWSSNY